MAPEHTRTLVEQVRQLGLAFHGALARAGQLSADDCAYFAHLCGLIGDEFGATDMSDEAGYVRVALRDLQDALEHASVMPRHLEP